MTPTAMTAAEPGDSIEVTKLLADARTEAMELNRDAADMDSFATSNLSWSTYASKVERIKEHVNNAGKLLAKLKDAEAEGSAWQRTAIARIEPLLTELAGNTEKTIHYLNDNSTKIHFPEFKEYVRSNYELASTLEVLIKDFVSYGESKQKFERLEKKLEITG